MPLIPVVFKNLGGRAEQWGSLYAVYSATQIVGGVMMGYTERSIRTSIRVSSEHARSWRVLLYVGKYHDNHTSGADTYSHRFSQTNRHNRKGFGSRFDTEETSNRLYVSLQRVGASRMVLGSMAGSAIVSGYGLQASTNLSALLYLFNFIFAFFGLPDKAEEDRSSKSNSRVVKGKDNRNFCDKVKTLYRSKRVLIYVTIKIVTQFVRSGLYSIGSFYLVDRFEMPMEELGKYVF